MENKKYVIPDVDIEDIALVHEGRERPYTNRKEKYPSKEFSSKTGIPNLYTNWVIDSIYIWFDIYQFCFKYNLFIDKLIINKMYNRLLKYNKQLKDIKVNSSINKMDVVFCAISKFMYDDIKFFVENYDTIIDYNNEMKDKYDEIETSFEVKVEWVMSPQTINHVLSYKGKIPKRIVLQKIPKEELYPKWLSNNNHSFFQFFKNIFKKS